MLATINLSMLRVSTRSMSTAAAVSAQVPRTPEANVSKTVSKIPSIQVPAPVPSGNAAPIDRLEFTSYFKPLSRLGWRVQRDTKARPSLSKKFEHDEDGFLPKVLELQAQEKATARVLRRGYGHKIRVQLATSNTVTMQDVRLASLIEQSYLERHPNVPHKISKARSLTHGQFLAATSASLKPAKDDSVLPAAGPLPSDLVLPEISEKAITAKDYKDTVSLLYARGWSVHAGRQALAEKEYSSLRKMFSFAPTSDISKFFLHLTTLIPEAKDWVSIDSRADRNQICFSIFNEDGFITKRNLNVALQAEIEFEKKYAGGVGNCRMAGGTLPMSAKEEKKGLAKVQGKEEASKA